MKKAKFRIGDRVRCGTVDGTIADVFSGNDSTAYGVDFGRHGVSLYFEEELELIPEKKFSMQINIDIANNVVIASLYEVVDPNMRPIAKGHGHIIHEGELGIAQAASYACMRLYKSMGGDKK